jgi:four helix bundle protein
MGQGYRDLVAWQKSVALVTDVYRATRTFPADERFGLTSQMRRAAVSVPSNIAEGHGRQSPGEFRQFLGQARGSLSELETQLEIAANLELLDRARAQALQEQVAEVGRILNGLLTSLRQSSCQ